MALITSCQATFQNFSGYEDDIASLEENIGNATPRSQKL